MAEKPHWDLVGVEDGRSWEVWRSGRAGGKASEDLFGTIAVGEFGYAVRDTALLQYGPFSTLDDAAYALAARESLGDPILLGDPVAGAPVPDDVTNTSGSGGIAPVASAPVTGAAAAATTSIGAGSGSGSGIGAGVATGAAPLPVIGAGRLPQDQRSLVLLAAGAAGALVLAVLGVVLLRTRRSH